MSRFLLEIGTEELPPLAVGPALEQLRRDMVAALDDRRLGVGEVRTTGTGRRLVLIADGLAARQEDRVTFVRGPAARVAFDDRGAPTQAALGFARSRGVPVEHLQVRDMDGGRYVVAEVRQPGRPAAEVLRAILPGLVAGLAFPKTMRWAPHGFRFARPIRWVVALLDRRVVPVEIAGVRAGRRTVGHRFLAPRPIALPDAGAYQEAVRRARVVLDPEERRRLIVEGASALAAAAGGRPIIDPGLLEELVWAIEHPTPMLGTFDPALAASLPRPVVLVTLQHHQKCFGVASADGALLPAFVAVRDGGDDHLASVRTGHEWVVGARLADAAFFIEEDRRAGFDRWIEGLERVTHVAGLGSMADHARRLEAVAAHLAAAVGMPEAERAALARAARLCKADLVTALVREFPELQGVIGGIYARERGEAEAVAAAIEEHYRPRFAGDAAPATPMGALLALADRAVLLAGALLQGLEPTGSQDPYALRRAASGVVAILRAHGLAIGLGGLFEAAAGAFEAPDDARTRAASDGVRFTLQRLRTALLEEGLAYDTVDAVMAAGGDDVVDLAARARALQAIRGDPVVARLEVAFARASRILDQGEAADEVDAARLTEPAEAALYRMWRAVADEVDRAAAARRYPEALAALARLADPIDAFFEQVLVLAPDPAVRSNRLALLRGVSESFRRVADLGRLAG